jgi:hypothetical protein
VQGFEVDLAGGFEGGLPFFGLVGAHDEQVAGVELGLGKVHACILAQAEAFARQADIVEEFDIAQ